jgi:hypothetical protein
LGQQLPILANEWCANTEINQVQQLLNLRGSVALHIVGVLGLLKHPDVQFCLVLSGASKCPSLLLLVLGQGIRQNLLLCLANQNVAWLDITVNIT